MRACREPGQHGGTQCCVWAPTAGLALCVHCPWEPSTLLSPKCSLKSRFLQPHTKNAAPAAWSQRCTGKGRKVGLKLERVIVESTFCHGGQCGGIKEGGGLAPRAVKLQGMLVRMLPLVKKMLWLQSQGL